MPVYRPTLATAVTKRPPPTKWPLTLRTQPNVYFKHQAAPSMSKSNTIKHCLSGVNRNGVGGPGQYSEVHIGWYWLWTVGGAQAQAHL
ncbi:unnamed protein product [Ceratitis capitata]|uniref:(Mediterranean fruit fly) hypothetical protein n=1 Tax=Ceratitis capitata TaxID=7213 RepID=A0A811TYR9_CERCA|nr:unnamed protein product [Ceratitis capitata]